MTRIGTQPAKLLLILADMQLRTATIDPTPTSRVATGLGEVRQLISRLLERSDPPAPWNLNTGTALTLLVLLWAWQLFATWGGWGNVTIDSGHEMYIPALLAQGKMLYRDVWFMYGPASAYFNSYLFRLFGIHLSVLYWAGSLSALGSAIFLYLIGVQLSARLSGLTAGAVVLLEAFQPSLFCFPLPYTFAAVYACLIGCVFLWIAIRTTSSTGWAWMFAAGTTAAIALLLKPEYGMTCYFVLALLVGLRGFRQRSVGSIVLDILAILPGVAICVAVIFWMVSIRGAEFITQENIVSWPTSYFMKSYGKMWLAGNGFSFTPSALGSAILRSLFPAGVVLELYLLLKWKRTGTAAVLMRFTLFLGLIAYYVFFLGLSPQKMVAALTFPQDMVLYVAIAAAVAWWSFWWQSAGWNKPAVPIALTFSGLLAFRILFLMKAAEYPIYYNGPVILCFLLLVTGLLQQLGHRQWQISLGELLICLLCATSAVVSAGALTGDAAEFVPLVTERGTIRVSQHMKDSYEPAIRFMKEKAALGESVLSVPEDTSLYFLSGTDCPTRVFSFTPGVLAPGKMTDELIQEIEQKRVRYLLWSNRMFPEFGVPLFGKDFDQPVGDYLKSHYRPVGPLIPDHGHDGDWSAQVWERIPENGSLQSLLPR
jgi:hypothetical protein